MYHFTFDFSKGIARVQHPAETSKDLGQMQQYQKILI